MSKQRVYISSVISGDEESAKLRFAKRKEELENDGFLVINPFKEKEDKAWLECLIEDVKLIKYNVTMVDFFGKWYRSCGCWMEFLVAIRHKKVCQFAGIRCGLIYYFFRWLWKIGSIKNK